MNATISPSQNNRLQSIFRSSHSYASNNRENEPPLCEGPDSVEESINYLDKEIQMLGLPPLYDKSGEFDVTRLINSTYTLLRRTQQSSRYREDLENRLCQHNGELEYYQTLLKKQKQSLKNKNTEMSKYEQLKRQLQINNSQLQTKLKLQSDELRRVKATLTQNENQYKHELKKKEKQFNLIKERAHYLLNDKSRPGGAAGIDISSCLNRLDGKRGKWRNESQLRNEDELQNKILVNFEMKCAHLLSENNTLRQILSNVSHEFNQLVQTVSPNHQHVIHTDMVNLPTDLIHSKITSTIRNNCDELKSNLHSTPKPNHDNGQTTPNSSPSRLSERSPATYTSKSHLKSPRVDNTKSPRIEINRTRADKSNSSRQSLNSSYESQPDHNSRYVLEHNSQQPSPNKVLRRSMDKNERIAQHIEQLKLALDIHRSPPSD